jgi:cellulose synthase (UDP-forming)
MLHQGMTYYDATFWVGANAILRRTALEDIAEVDNTGQWPVKRYISDNTVIEDTESSIDLVSKKWRLHNYAERLSYSATPPDFGSCCRSTSSAR